MFTSLTLTPLNFILNFSLSTMKYFFQACVSNLLIPLYNWYLFNLLLRSSLVAHLFKNPPAIQETPVRFWVGKIHWRRNRLPTPVFLAGGFPHSSVICLQSRRPGVDSWLGRSSGEGNGKPLQYSCLENSMDRGAWHGRRSPLPWGRKSWTWLSN